MLILHVCSGMSNEYDHEVFVIVRFALDLRENKAFSRVEPIKGNILRKMHLAYDESGRMKRERREEGKYQYCTKQASKYRQ